MILFLCSALLGLSQITPDFDSCIKSVDTYIENEQGSFVQFNVYKGISLLVHPNDPKYMLAFVNRQNRWQIPSVNSTSGACQGPFFCSHDAGVTWKSAMVDANEISDSIYVPSAKFTKFGSKLGTIYALVGFDDQDSSRIDPPHAWSGTSFTKSTDAGDAWTTPVILDQAHASKLDEGFTQASGGNLCVDVKDGAKVYVSLHFLNPSHGLIRFTRSQDAGDSWTPTVTIYDPQDDQNLAGFFTKKASFPCLAMVKSGRNKMICCAFHREFQKHQNSHVSCDHALIRSENDGDNWELDPVVIARYQPSKIVNPVTLRTIEHNAHEIRLAVDEHSKIIYALWDGAHEDSAAIFLSYSKDLGKSWSKPLKVNKTAEFANNPLANQAFNGSIAVTETGLVGIIYYDFRKFIPDSDFAATDVWLDIYKPLKSGLEFVREVRLTDVSFSINTVDDSTFDPLLNAGGLGQNLGIDSFEKQFYTAFCKTQDSIEETLIVRPTNKPLALIDFNPRTHCFFEKIKNEEASSSL